MMWRPGNFGHADAVVRHCGGDAGDMGTVAVLVLRPGRAIGLAGHEVSVRRRSVPRSAGDDSAEASGPRLVAMAMHRELDGGEPLRARPVERLAGHHELREAGGSWHLADGTLACPACDAPILPGAGAMSPPDPISCSFCAHAGAVRDFLSLAKPTRPTRVVVRLRGFVPGRLPAPSSKSPTPSSA